MTSRSTTTLEQGPASNSKSRVRATVTGVDSAGQLFRDSALVIFLKGQKCICESSYKPSSDSSVMVELRIGGEAWRSDAKVQAVSPTGPGKDSFRVTLELDRVPDAVVETNDAAAVPPAISGATESKRPAAVVAPTETARDRDLEALGTPAETTTPDLTPAPAPAAKKISAPAPPGAAADPSIKPAPAPTPAAKAAVTDLVRSIMASEVEQWRRDLQTAVASQVEAALQQPFRKIEARIEQQLQKRPDITEESVQKIAAQTVEDAQIQSATTTKQLVAEALRSAMASHSDQQRREISALVPGEIETAWRGPLAARVSAQVEKAVDTRFEEYSRRRPSLTEDAVRQLAAQVAERIQLEWASTKLQKMIAEAARSAVTSESAQRRPEMAAMISGEIETAIRGPLAARIDDTIQKAMAAKIDRYFQTPSAIAALQALIAEAVRSAVAQESAQRRPEIAAMISGEIETAIRGPLAARMDDTIQKALAAKIDKYFQAPSTIAALQELLAEVVRQPLDAEYEQRGRQVQAVVSKQIEAAVRGPVATQIDEMLGKALEAQREEYLRNPPPVTEDTLQKITANIAQHPQLQASIDALSATLSDRWAEIARGATANAQQDINSRVTATERLANQVVLDIQQKLNSFDLEMNRILGPQESVSPSAGGSQPADEPERDKRFRDLLQSTGSHFEREMKAALQKIFGKS